MLPNKKNTAKKYTALYGVAAVWMIAVVVSSHYAVEHFKKQKAQTDYVLNPVREFHSDIVQLPAEPVKDPLTVTVVEQKQELKIPRKIMPAKVIADVTHPVSPPLPEMIGQRKTVAVEATKGQVIQTETRSKISIPPDAFVDASGKAVRGKVDIKYREYHNYQDILFSGIPMTWKNGNKQQQLESAGMIELLAYSGTNEVYLNPARRINVLLSSAQRTGNFNLYYFDQRKKEWVMKKALVPLEYDNGQGWDVDNTAYFNNYYEVVDTIFNTSVYDKRKYPVRFRSFTNMKSRRKFLVGKKETPDNFDFLMYASTRGYPELEPLKGQLWNYSGQDALSVYSMLMREVGPSWYKMVISQSDTSENYYTLSLYSTCDSFRVDVKPKLKNARQQREFEKKFDQYTDDYIARLEKEKNKYIQWQKDSATIKTKFSVVRRRRDCDYYSGSYRRIASTTDLAMRMFEVDRFGIWNCDRPIEIPQSVTVQASFSDQNGKILNPGTVYVVDKNLNTVYSYYRNITDSITFNPKSTNMIWMVLTNGRMAVLKPIELKKNTFAKNSRQYNFVMQVYNKPKDEAEIKKLVTL